MIETVRVGPHRIGPQSCPKCGLDVSRVSGMKGGKPAKDYRQSDAPRIMVCARCESAICRWQDHVLVLDAAGEAALPPEARDALIETRNQLRLHKALGIISVPETGP